MRVRFGRVVGVLVSILLLLVGHAAQTAPQRQHIYVVDRGNSRIVRMNDMTGAGWASLGTAGSGARQFSFPRGIFVDARGRIYAADTDNHRIIQVQDITGAGWATLGSSGSGTRQFNKPRGIFVDASGRIFVADSANHRIVRIDDMSGAGWTTFGTFVGGASKDKPGNLVDPAGIFVDGKSRIYIADVGSGYDLRRIIRIDDMRGVGWTWFPPPDTAGYGVWGRGVNMFNSPGGVFVDPVGKIYVADTANHRIVRINDMAGAAWTMLGTQGSGVKQFSLPSGIALDATGRIYVADAGNGRIVRVDDMSGAGWTSLGSQGSGVKQFSLPSVVVVR